jgi:phosphoribosyl 1,2-cyclic phosphodiesterase
LVGVTRGRDDRGNRISLRVSILASGSSGNCTLLETSQTRLLVDAGLGKKETLRRLAAVERQVDRLDGIVISHEHSDHIGGLAHLLAQWRTTVYLTAATHAEVLRILPETHAKRLERVEFIEAGQRFAVGDIEVSPIAIPHDAADPLGFTFCAGGVKVAVITDLGYMPALVKHHLRNSDGLVLESNHDLEMLKVGPYPWHVKQRVMSRTGHLSNDTVSEFLADPEGFDARSRYLVLAHLSESNNNPDVARISAQEALGRRPGESAFRGELLIASQSEPLPPIQL